MALISQFLTTSFLRAHDWTFTPTTLIARAAFVPRDNIREKPVYNLYRAMPIVATPFAVLSVWQFSEVVAAYAERKIVRPVYDASYLKSWPLVPFHRRSRWTSRDQAAQRLAMQSNEETSNCQISSTLGWWILATTVMIQTQLYRAVCTERKRPYSQGANYINFAHKKDGSRPSRLKDSFEKSDCRFTSHRPASRICHTLRRELDLKSY